MESEVDPHSYSRFQEMVLEITGYLLGGKNEP